MLQSVFTLQCYLAPSRIIIRCSSGAIELGGLLMFHSTFEHAACLKLYVCPGLIPAVFSSTRHSTIHTSHPAPANHQPPTICCHCDQSPFHRTSHLTGMACSKAIPYLLQINSWTNLWSLLPWCPSSIPSLLYPTHICASSSSSVYPLMVSFFSNWSHISSLWPPLSSFYLSFCHATPLTFTHPQHDL